MMSKFFTNIFNWIKNHKLNTFLIIVVAYFLLVGTTGSPSRNKSNMYSIAGSAGIQGIAPMTEEAALYDSVSAPMAKTTSSYYRQEAAPNINVTDRKVITNTSMSLKVKSVKDSFQAIKDKVTELKGYIVTTSITTPEFGESGYITLRIPSQSLEEALKFFRSISLKVVSENTSGNDITDQYVDYQEKLKRLNATKLIFEEMLVKATTIDDILRVQSEIFNQQNQIDNITGKMKYMDGASETTLISLNLATDELGLPITPIKSWRPEIIFKQATRSMLSTVYDLGEAAIWLIVYSPVLLGAFALYIVIKKLFFSRKTAK